MASPRWKMISITFGSAGQPPYGGRCCAAGLAAFGIHAIVALQARKKTPDRCDVLSLAKYLQMLVRPRLPDAGAHCSSPQRPGLHLHRHAEGRNAMALPATPRTSGLLDAADQGVELLQRQPREKAQSATYRYQVAEDRQPIGEKPRSAQRRGRCSLLSERNKLLRQLSQLRLVREPSKPEGRLAHRRHHRGLFDASGPDYQRDSDAVPSCPHHPSPARPG